MNAGEDLIGIALAAGSLTGLAWCAARLIAARRENAKKQFLYEFSDADCCTAAFASELATGSNRFVAGGGGKAGAARRGTLNQNTSLRTGTGA
jgi:hypothetical protein